MNSFPVLTSAVCSGVLAYAASHIVVLMLKALNTRRRQALARLQKQQQDPARQAAQIENQSKGGTRP